MTRIALAYAGALLAFVALDLVWLGVVAREFYQAQVGSLLRDRPNWAAAFLLYAVYAAGLAYFAIVPALDTGRLADAALRGALMGLVVYATYDLTNLATLRGWTLPVAAADILWGVCVSAAAAAAGHALARLA